MVNKRLQQKGQNICQLFGHVQAFRKKLELFISSLKKNNAVHFPFYHKLVEEGKIVDFAKSIEIVEAVSEQFRARFSQFDLVEKEMKREMKISLFFREVLEGQLLSLLLFFYKPCVVLMFDNVKQELYIK